MNAENLRILAHELRADPQSYDQTTLHRKTDCGTVACIAGHAAHLAQPGRNSMEGGMIDAAAEWLGLDYDEADALFVASPLCCNGTCGSHGWPTAFARRYYRAISDRSVEAPAFVAADLLDALADGKVTL